MNFAQAIDVDPAGVPHWRAELAIPGLLAGLFAAASAAGTLGAPVEPPVDRRLGLRPGSIASKIAHAVHALQKRAGAPPALSEICAELPDERAATIKQILVSMVQDSKIGRSGARGSYRYFMPAAR